MVVIISMPRRSNVRARHNHLHQAEFAATQTRQHNHQKLSPLATIGTSAIRPAKNSLSLAIRPVAIIGYKRSLGTVCDFRHFSLERPPKKQRADTNVRPSTKKVQPVLNDDPLLRRIFHNNVGHNVQRVGKLILQEEFHATTAALIRVGVNILHVDLRVAADPVNCIQWAKNRAAIQPSLTG
jgi:hypothetical protein